VEREYLGRTEPTDEDKRIVDHRREWFNDGTVNTIDDYYDFFTKWFERNNNSVLYIPTSDEAGEYFYDYEISGIERYEYHDGTILTIPRIHTIQSLMDNFNVTAVLDVSVDTAENDPYYIRRKITFGGVKINNGTTNSFERIWSTMATYTTSYDSPAGAQKSTETGTRILRWQS
jgi:hypothetical protein